jgi:hypothetical protein
MQKDFIIRLEKCGKPLLVDKMVLLVDYANLCWWWNGIICWLRNVCTDVYDQWGTSGRYGSTTEPASLE